MLTIGYFIVSGIQTYSRDQDRGSIGAESER